MRLFKLTAATIFQRKAWAIGALAILVLPFVLPWISSASEKPILLQPARIQAAWTVMWICGLSWGLFTAAHEGDRNAQSGLGEYFKTTGIGHFQQLFQIWLAIIIFIVPMAIVAGMVCQIGAGPANPEEKKWWWILILQYIGLFVMVMGPLIALAIGLASRFGGIAGFSFTLLLALYGLFGVGYLDSLLKIEENPMISGLLALSPQYRFADLTQRMYFKSGALTAETFITMTLYFLSLGMIYAAVARLSLRIKA